MYIQTSIAFIESLKGLWCPVLLVHPLVREKCLNRLDLSGHMDVSVILPLVNQ